MHKGGLFYSILASILTIPTFANAQTTPVFGPERFTRGRGQPYEVVRTFSHCGSAQCQAVITNGNSDGSKRISSAVITINGVQLIGPSDFNQHVNQLTKPVAVEGSNEIAVTLASRPGSFLSVEIDCAEAANALAAGRAGASVLSPTELSIALPIENEGTAAALNVTLTSVTLDSGTLTDPALPAVLGSIPGGGTAIFDADFTGSFAPATGYGLTVSGTYETAGATSCFTLHETVTTPPAAPGSAQLSSVSVGSAQVTGAPYPAQPPDFEDEGSELRWPVPRGRFVAATPTATSTVAGAAPMQNTRSVSPVEAGEVVFVANNGLGIDDASTIAEPSGGSTGGGVVFMSGNWFAAYSTDGGGTFTELNPTSVFPADTVGFCCDQIVQYVPSIDRFIWLLQGNGYRLASASPADVVSSGGTAWTYWNLSPDVFGQPSGSFDFPDLSVGDNSLYISWDASGNRQVARTSLAGLQAGGTITVEFTDPVNGTTAWSAHLTQDTGNEIFWAGHPDESSLRVFSLAEGSQFYFWRDIGISSWSKSGLSSLTPDGQDWLTDVRNTSFTSTLGATRSYNQLWFAWNAGTDDNFQQPHVEMVTLDRANDFSVVQQVQIWNNNYAFAYPALATNICTGEVGLSLEYGGNGNYQNHVVGFWGDFVVYITTASDVGTLRSGDYVTIRQQPPSEDNGGNLFDAFGFGLDLVSPPATGVRTDIHYVVFGRPASTCVIPRVRSLQSGPRSPSHGRRNH